MIVEQLHHRRHFFRAVFAEIIIQKFVDQRLYLDVGIPEQFGRHVRVHIRLPAAKAVIIVLHHQIFHADLPEKFHVVRPLPHTGIIKQIVPEICLVRPNHEIIGQMRPFEDERAVFAKLIGIVYRIIPVKFDGRDT